MGVYDDTPESDWNGDYDFGIPPTPRERRAIDIGQDRNTFRVLREDFRRQCMAATSAVLVVRRQHQLRARFRTSRGRLSWTTRHPVSVRAGAELRDVTTSGPPMRSATAAVRRAKPTTWRRSSASLQSSGKCWTNHPPT